MCEKNLKSKELKNFQAWMREVLSWACIGIRNAFPYVVLIGILCWICFYKDSISACKERDIRWIGLFIQIIGFGLVAWQLTNIRILFRKPAFYSRIMDYLMSFPSRHLKTVSIEAHLRGGPSTVEARVTVKPGPNTPMERRVELLENAVGNVEKEAHDIRQALGSLRTEYQRSVEEVRQETRKEVGEVKELIDDAIIGGILTEWVGIIYFVIGIFLSTIAPELSAWLGYEGQCGQLIN